MKIVATSIFVEDQERARDFYTEKLGFELKHDIDMGDAKWLTVTEPKSNNPVEIVLEPNAHPVAKNYQLGLFNDGIPVTMFATSNLAEEYEALVARGVQFTTEPKEVEGINLAVFDDTCGNLIQLIEQ
ncbi:VOC family protein [Staphylococcus arlettae]|jgi:predicted enzyme related to lactoylglutathione lyase|uniref:Lactoylglutathione lyase n=1 Tax=Staphylococcus arlettae TaxID=29378 RepID=A0A380CX28_9STAP|nr:MULTISPECIES: VOC family protein [Staphylococcus]EJY96058.1 lactoylglutathione lyase [Staphylococcus arlettae CVD059]MCD8849348.1 VOC family protein [Staphylococcus arlettae]MCD8907734.1 VOC family protein [Staphylococcus arlettae]MDT3893767.1 VOC family protein [Staphylococcus arlettae]MEB6067206.1 VOC family protein [Staphylococcus arlettae]